jgi:hypothetical protein
VRTSLASLKSTVLACGRIGSTGAPRLCRYAKAKRMKGPAPPLLVALTKIASSGMPNLLERGASDKYGDQA